jgi:hypothetical protein
MRPFRLVAPVLTCLALGAVPAFGVDCRLAGDVAPGVLDASVSPSLFVTEGDGRITVADVVAILRGAVGLSRLTPPTGSTCPVLPGDLSPGVRDLTTSPPTWRPTGDGRLDVADVVLALRAAVGMDAMETPSAASEARLVQIPACPDLEAWIKGSALRAIDAGAYWWYPWWGVGGPVPAGDGDVVQAGGAEGGRSASRTNVQEAGVDEADIVKNDDTYIYALSAGRVMVVRAWPADDLQLVATIPVEGWANGMYLLDGRLVVLSVTWEAPGAASGALIAPEAMGGTTKVSVFDVTIPEEPLLQRELYVEGWLQSSRVVDGRLLLVLYHALHGPAAPDWTGDEATWRQALRDAVRASTLDQWLPHLVDARFDGAAWDVSRGRVVPCDQVFRPYDVDQLGLTSILSIDPAGVEPNGGVAVAAAASATYASPTTLVVAETRWRADGVTQGTSRLHAFDLATDVAHPEYLASGGVPGMVPTPFALDVEGDQLRVATHVWTWSGETWSSVHVLRKPAVGQDMQVVGAVTGIAPGEQLRAVRFQTKRAFLVTFRQVDPLFTVDLTVPSAPTVLGELQVTGFSTYLHPLGEDHLIGVGTEVDPATQRQLGLQVSLFDVADLTMPELLDREVVDTGWSWSAAQQDHHAFNWFPEHQALALPVVHVQYEIGPTGEWLSRSFNGIHVYRIEPATGVTLLGALDLLGVTGGDTLPLSASPWCAQVQRSVFIEDRLYAISDAGIAVAPLSALDTPLDTVAFPPPAGLDGWCGCLDCTVGTEDGDASGGAPGG